jgi:hypothetical protein
MATTPKIIAEIATVSDSETAVYTNPSGTVTYLKSIIVTNYSGDPCDLSVWKVPNGESTENSNILIPGLEITAGDHVAFHYGDPGIMMDTNGDKIYVQAGTASKLNIHMYGYTS